MLPLHFSINFQWNSNKTEALSCQIKINSALFTLRPKLFACNWNSFIVFEQQGNLLSSEHMKGKCICFVHVMRNNLSPKKLLSILLKHTARTCTTVSVKGTCTFMSFLKSYSPAHKSSPLKGFKHLSFSQSLLSFKISLLAD